MSKHKVSRGNTSDLIGLWNNRATTDESDKSTGLIKPSNLLSVNPARKTSAYVPRIVENEVELPKFRKTSAMVLLPTSRSISPSPTAGQRCLNVDSSIYSPESWKKSTNVSGLEKGQTELPKLRSALKLSTVSPPVIKTENVSNSDTRRGSVGLGRSKSVCHKVKFVPQIVKTENYSTEITGGVNSQNNTKSVDHSTPRLTRQASLPSLNKEKTTNLSASNQSNPVRRSTVVARSPSSAKEVILSWVQERTNTYPNLKVTNFSSSWNNGLAFCALIHYYYPEAFEYDKLDPKNRKYNFDLAFKSAEKYADICPLLDVEDMVMFEKPDWKCVFTYVQSFYRRFRNGRDPPVPTKKLTLTPPPKAIPASKSIE